MNGIFSSLSLPRIRRHNLQSKLLALALGCLLVILHHYLFKTHSGTDFTTLEIQLDLPDNFIPVRITKREYFPSSGTPKIPKIIHQVWRGIYIPPDFDKWIKTWEKHHPDWQYWLWTEKSARQFIADKYPCLLEVYDNYPEKIRRADAIRYIVLYEIGGVYADMDMEALGSFLPLVLKYPCFFGKEPFEHPILDTNFQDLINNAIIGCRPKHPFMKLLMDNLDSFSKQWHHLDSTGPHYVSFIYRQNASEIKSQNGDNEVYIAPSEYFYPTIDPYKILTIKTVCQNTRKLSKLQIRACMNIKYKNLPENRFDPLTIAFSNHHWYHTYLRQMPSTLAGHKSIFDIVPGVIIYKNIRD